MKITESNRLHTENYPLGELTLISESSTRQGRILGMLLSGQVIREVHRHIYVVHVRSRTEFTSAPYIGLESVKEWQVHLQRVSEGLYANPAISRTNNTAGPYIAHT